MELIVAAEVNCNLLISWGGNNSQIVESGDGYKIKKAVVCRNCL
jgi:hypothetical protein